MAPLAVCCHGVGHDILIKLISEIRDCVLFFTFLIFSPANWKHHLHSRSDILNAFGTRIKTRIPDFIFENIRAKQSCEITGKQYYVKSYNKNETLYITVRAF